MDGHVSEQTIVLFLVVPVSSHPRWVPSEKTLPHVTGFPKLISLLLVGLSMELEVQSETEGPHCAWTRSLGWKLRV